MLVPLATTAVGIIACIITSIIATDFSNVNQNNKIQSTLKLQLIISTILLAVGLAIVFVIMPSEFKMKDKK